MGLFKLVKKELDGRKVHGRRAPMAPDKGPKCHGFREASSGHDLTSPFRTYLFCTQMKSFKITPKTPPSFKTIRGPRKKACACAVSISEREACLLGSERTFPTLPPRARGQGPGAMFSRGPCWAFSPHVGHTAQPTPPLRHPFPNHPGAGRGF